MSDLQYRDVVYAKPDGIDLLARCFSLNQSNGHGVVMVHGGAWTANDRITPSVLCNLLAHDGFFVLSLDFRCGPEYQHPTASSDIAAGTRYLRSNCESYGIRENTIGIVGSSSGGHLSLFVGYQPDIPSHQTTHHLNSRDELSPANNCSASVSYIVALWPVSNPFYRYQYAKRVGRWELVEAHDGFFGTEERMKHASVPAALQIFHPP